MAQYARYGQQRGGSVGARAIAWIAISLLFLAFDLVQLHKIHAAGLTPTWFLWAQIVVWGLALLFWVYSGVRSLRKGKVQ